MKLGLNLRPAPANAPSLRAHAIATMTAPPRLLRDHIDYEPGLLGNGDCGNCTCVAVANAILAQAALSGYRVGITTPEVVRAYSAISGYDPATGANDTGANEVDVLTWQARHGLTADGQTPYVGLWANIGPGDLNLIRLAVARLGVAYLAVNLALADQHDGVWDVDTPTSYGDPKPGSWGGHALLAFDYDSETVGLVTWGAIRRCTYSWFRSRVVEAHALVHPQLIGPARLNSAGLDADTLRADVAGFSA